MIKKRKKVRLTLALIVRNEKKSSEIIFPQIPKKSVDEIIVIDGHSSDGTQKFYKDAGIPVFEQKIKGLGGAALEARKRCKMDAIIFFHPDGNEDPKDIAKIAEKLKSGHQFVIPSRMIKNAYNEEDAQLLKPRKWFNQTMALFVNLLWNEKHPFVSEIVQGFRGVTCESMDTMKCDKTDCTIDFQMVIRALKYHIPIYEFPTIEKERLFGETNFKSIDTGKKELKMLAREIFDFSTYPKINLISPLL